MYPCDARAQLVVGAFPLGPGLEKHDASLEPPEGKAAIAAVVSLLTGEFTRHELSLVGGLGGV